jgi:hypothetical protein
MAKARERVRDLVRDGKPAPPPKGQRGGGKGAGGGLPENPEARAAEDFAPGGSAGPSAKSGRAGNQMRSPGGRAPGA